MANKKKKQSGSFRPLLTITYIVLLLALGYMFFYGDGKSSNSRPVKVELDEIYALADSGDIKQIEFSRDKYEGTVTLKQECLTKHKDLFDGKVPNKSPHLTFIVSAAFNPEESFGALNERLPEDRRFKLVMTKDDRAWGQVLEWILMPLMLILMWVMMFRMMNRGGAPGGSGGIFNVGKSTGKMADKNQVKVNFKDVAGLYGAKEEVMEIVDFLKNPKKYTSLGGKIPKGALLVGPPGTGKTLLAKAVAGEANVPFFSISGSDFVEMFVGVGASRVRDLFRQAKEKAPCIVFIDEIDAVGRARGKNAGFSSNDERENTLNQLLTEMDGFGSNSGVIILAATNRADILDKALMRAGRFDRQIHVELPDLNERKEIFQVHTRKLKLEKGFDLELIAKHTPGFSGADIANVCNEAALTAARKNKSSIDMSDFLDAVDRIVGGIERKKTIMTKSEKELIAYHEAGHTLVGWLLPDASPVLKVTVIPRGQALGLTWNLPDERVIQSRDQLMAELCVLMGGRVAEEIHSGVPCSGALNDLERLTRLAYAMVSYYGMNERIGNISFYDSTGERGFDLTKPYSENTATAIDEEVKKLVDEVHERTLKLIKEHADGFEQLARELIDKEVVLAEDIERILGPKAGKHGEERFEE
ncbi:MAG: ATP-dependent zinc metalloprotease FtsH [Candidatus Cryptobacteroides sp.]|nr:ATP-dependent zinc metalloprotease FtsH [Bacteroidales bacterium]MDY5743893.1 ATP-dependent zinc metalloprotease FtsH [Candidatus Cryptobacteroides sp.]